MIFTRPIHVSAQRLAIAAFALSMAAPVVAAGTLSLEQAEKRALERDNVARLLDSRRQQAQGELTTAGLWSNPTIELSQESTDLAETTSRERFYWLYQEFDVSGEQGLRREAAQALLEATGFAVGATRMDIRTRVRRLFFDKLYRQRQIEAVAARRERLAELVDRVRRQEQAGQAAQYDVARLERAADALGAREAALKAERERSLARLAALLGDPSDDLPSQRLAGELVPPPPAPLDSLLDSIDTLPRIQQLQAQARASALTAKAEGRAAVPDLTLGVGYKEQEEFGRSFDGNLISLGVSIPLFDRNQGKRASARAAARASEAEYRLALAELRGDIRGRWLQQRALLESAKAYRKSNAASTRKLLRAAESGYRGAEIGVLEVVDAYESALEAELRVLELQKQARDAHIDLQALTHGVPQP